MKTEPKNTPFRSVADLVAPMSFSDFHKMYWGKGFHYFPATDERRAQAKALFNLESFLESVFKVHVRDTRLSLSHDGNKLSENENAFAIEKLSWKTRPTLEQLENLCASKSTLIFNSIEIGWQELTNFCRNSMQILGESVNMNAYFSPATGVLGLGCHYDIQEHFIIQFSGKKTWRTVYEGLEPNPTEKLFSTKA